MVSMSHLCLEGPVTVRSVPDLWHHSWRLPCSNRLASPIGLGSCEHHGQHRSTLDVSDPIPRLLVWPGRSQAEWSRLQASKLRSRQLLDGTGNSRLTWLPEMFFGLSKVYRGSMISVDFQGNRSSGPHCNGKIDGVLSLLISPAP